MRKIIFALLILLAVLSLFACSALPTPPSGGGNSNDLSPDGEIGGDSGGDKGDSSVDGGSSPGGSIWEDIVGGLTGGSSSGGSAEDSEGGSGESSGDSSGGFWDDIFGEADKDAVEMPPIMSSPDLAPGESGSSGSGDDEVTEDIPDVDEEEKPIVLPSGMITAGAVNDNDGYQAWLDLFAQGDETNGKFFDYTNPDYSWGYNSLNRIKVSVKNGDAPVSGATVVATDNQGVAYFSAVTDANGNAYLFTDLSEGLVTVTGGDANITTEFSKDIREISLDLGADVNKLNVIEIMLVVDVTGSMGDEIHFLKAELADVINRIAENDSNTIIKLAMLFYRDTDDKVPFDYYDFVDVTTEEGLAQQQAALDKQKATGGGDYPEAVDQALEMAVNQQWSTGATTKIIFHVLDAPAHTGDKYAQKLVGATKDAAEKGIRICPIICSGAADLTEYTMREAAIYTGGTFIFVTDDSGIGGSHHKPETPEVTIELLNSLMVRLVKGYHTGVFEEPIFWKQDPNIGFSEYNY